ncbi:Serine palmitoyltransferase 2 [Smittium culicis]|uniref:serine C-palmitoyltransferase n=1 Tax=Smittium culicis TaxID=133412 RepID=A0A1R1WY47_9FUNG|nr:Serine palmitoyltransferase 2 [Smittium culicis]OMJ08997.1 Serine palmitoyltransferase 2 [Smittium culicis]
MLSTTQSNVELVNRKPRKGSATSENSIPNFSDLSPSPISNKLNASMLKTKSIKPNLVKKIEIEGYKLHEKALEPVSIKKKDHSDLEKVPIATLVTTYLSYLILILFAHLRDRIGKFFYPKQYEFLSETNGYAPLISDFESLWIRRLYTRISDCFSRPITGVAGGYVTLLERNSKDHNKTFELTGKSERVLNLASYNYLGFAQSHGYCADQVESIIRNNSVAIPAPRAQGGLTKALVETEALVARYLGVDDSIIISMGYATNSSVIPLLVEKGCLLISDELNHSSLVSGSRLSGASIKVFKHNDAADLERVLRKSISQGQPRTHRPWSKILVVVEGLYSMEGEFCNLREIVDLKNKYKFYLFVDEAHSIGAIGKHGRGICEHLGIDHSKIDVLMGTFTKSFGAVGGYIAGSKDLISRLRLKSHSSIYSEVMPYPVLAQVISTVKLLMNEVPELDGEGHKRIQALVQNSNFFITRLKEMGFMILGDKGSPVVPLLLFNPAKIPAFSHECLKRKIAVVVVSYPATPIITGRVRFCLSASHTIEDLEYALEQIDEIGDLLGLKLLKK